MMSPQQRNLIVLAHEGQVLQSAGHTGEANAGEHTRCVIDGCFNALSRFDGPESAAEFAFGVAERMIARVKTPTTFPARSKPDEQVEMSVDLPAQVAEEVRSSINIEALQIQLRNRIKTWRPSYSLPNWVIIWIIGVITGLILAGPR